MRDIGVGVCLLVVRDKKLLVSERIGKFGGGHLCCPGGHQEKNETWERTALRELVEEAGYFIKVKVVPNSTFALPSGSTTPIFVTNNVLGSNVHYVTIWLHGVWISGEPSNAEPTKKSGWVWMTLQELTDDPRMKDGVKAWIDGGFHDSLHWIPLPELYKYREKLGV